MTAAFVNSTTNHQTTIANHRRAHHSNRDECDSAGHRALRVRRRDETARCAASGALMECAVCGPIDRQWIRSPAGCRQAGAQSGILPGLPCRLNLEEVFEVPTSVAL